MPQPKRRSPTPTASSRRRTPTQERSQRLVATLIDATAQVCSEVGLEGLSTNKVAKAAGVAVGSIYQYFPDKESLLDAVVQDRFGRLAQLAIERMADVQGLSYRQAADTVLRAAVDFFASEPSLTQILAPYLAVPPPLPGAESAIQQVHDLAMRFLTSAATDLTLVDIGDAAFISIGVVSHFAPRIATIPDDAEREHLIDEVVAMLARYVGAT
jgi:AcrR family transcriptional regulator